MISFIKQKKLSLVIIAALVLLGFIIAYQKWSLASWLYPIDYKADHLFVHFFTHAYANFSILPFAAKTFSFLNAPFGGNVTDLPGNEDPLYFCIGLFQNIFGQYLGENLFLLVTLIANAISFFAFLVYFRIRDSLAIIGGVALGLSHYCLLRGFEHIILSTVWHLPPLLLIAYWYFDELTIWTKQKKIFAWASLTLTGFLFVYYSYLIIQLIAIGMLVHLSKKRIRLVISGVWMCALPVIGWFVGQLDTFAHVLKFGVNRLIMTRDLASIEQYSLKLADMFLPFTHIWWRLEAWTHKVYFDKNFLIHTEPGFSYIGVLGGLALVVILVLFVEKLINQKSIGPDRVWYIFLIWIFAYSVSGGINFLFAVVSKVYVFRCTNRFSIFIFMISLLLFFKVIDKYAGRWKSILLLLVVFVDLPGKSYYTSPKQVENVVNSDRSLMAQVEVLAKEDTQFFQMPVTDFPEYPKVFEMTDYEHFRPMLYSSKFRWSYGSTKGRGENDWQHQIEGQSAEIILKEIRDRNFGGIYLNKRGFADRAEKLKNEFTKLVPQGKIVESDDLFVIVF